jgi:hypothetical protein
VQPGLLMFSLGIQNAVDEGFLKRGDILVLDNALVIHYSVEIQDVEGWLSQEHGMFILYRTCQANPMEQIPRLKRVYATEVEFQGALELFTRRRASWSISLTKTREVQIHVCIQTNFIVTHVFIRID